MKSIFSLLLFTILATNVSAQTALDEQIALARQSANTDRQVVIMGNVHFTSEESAEFWPLWKEYRASMMANADRMVALIANFANNYDAMTDMKASEIMTDSFSIKMQDLVLKQKFAMKISKIMPPKKAMRIIQIENKLDAAIQMKLAAEIPLTRQ